MERPRYRLMFCACTADSALSYPSEYHIKFVAEMVYLYQICGRMVYLWWIHRMPLRSKEMNEVTTLLTNLQSNRIETNTSNHVVQQVFLRSIGGNDCPISRNRLLVLFLRSKLILFVVHTTLDLASHVLS